jgi:subtilase family serine protease
LPDAATALNTASRMTPTVSTGSFYYDQQVDVTAADMPDPTARCPVTCYGPTQIRNAYGIKPLLDAGLNGSGRTIVIVAAYQSPTLGTDLSIFDSVFGLPAPALSIVAPDGLTPFDPTSHNMVGWSQEINLDVEWAHAVAPGAAIVLLLARSDSDLDLLNVEQYAVDNDLGDVMSQSFGEAEACAAPSTLDAIHDLFKRARAKHWTVFAATGDTGAAQPGCNGSPLMKAISSPASDPLVTAVGGTHLTAQKFTGVYQAETGWHEFVPQMGAPPSEVAGGGGFSAVFKRPGYQAQITGPSRSRGVPDVAYNAAVNGGVIAIWRARLGIAGGTSAGAPQWAGLAAMADQMAGRRIGFLNNRLYELARTPAYGDDFHDVTSGENNFGPVPGFAAGSGWDPVTGLGSPVANSLVPLLAASQDPGD